MGFRIIYQSNHQGIEIKKNTSHQPSQPAYQSNHQGIEMWFQFYISCSNWVYQSNHQGIEMDQVITLVNFRTILSIEPSRN